MRKNRASEPTAVDPTQAFQFLGIQDGARCPHCGAEGRYIHVWAEYGVRKAAMAGCYKLMTGHIKKTDVDAYIERIEMKLSRNKPLNGWDKTIIRMQQYIMDNINDEGKVNWAKGKINQAVSESKQYIGKKMRG